MDLKTGSDAYSAVAKPAPPIDKSLEDIFPGLAQSSGIIELGAEVPLCEKCWRENVTPDLLELPN
jgi:hypothetical protein